LLGVVCIIVNDTLYMANIGDSEAILVSVSDQAAVSFRNMTTPHKASDQAEKERIEALGGHVFFGRVFGALAVSRSFGDAKYKVPKTSANFVSFDPAIQTENLVASHRYLVLACDGLWDVMTHQEAACMCHEAFGSGKSPNDVAKLLVETALKKHTEDNVTVVVVKIDWPNAPTTSVEHKAQGEKVEEKVKQEKIENTEKEKVEENIAKAATVEPAADKEHTIGKDKEEKPGEPHPTNPTKAPESS